MLRPRKCFSERPTRPSGLAQESEAATAAAAGLTRLSHEAESNASALEAAREEAESVAVATSSAHAQAIQEKQNAEAVIDGTPSVIQAAAKDRSTANKSVQEIADDLKDAQKTIDELSREYEKAAQVVNKIVEEQLAVQREADEASNLSEAAALAAASAREASNVAAQLAEASQQDSKSVRKAAEKSAKDAEKIKEYAESDAEQAARDAEKALEDLDKVNEQLNEARKHADVSAHDLAAAEAQSFALTEALDSANSMLDAAEQEIEAAESARDEAIQELDRLVDLIPRLGEQASLDSERAEFTAQQAIAARLTASHAATQADQANAEALRLAARAEAANKVLVAAETAIKDASQQQLGDDPESADHSFRAYALNFNRQDDGAFETVAGSSERLAGQLHLVPSEDLLAVAVLDNAALPERTATRVYTTIRADELPGLDQNAFIVFDYQSPEDFKYAGAWAGTDKWAIGEVINGQLVDVAELNEVIGQGPAYELQIWIQNDSLTLLVEGQPKLQHSFEEPVDDGQIGVASYGGRSRFDQVAVMQLYSGAGDVGIEQADVDPAAHDAAIREMY